MLSAMPLDQLQQTVKRLESGELSLEDSLKNFEQGVRLTRLCQQHLATAEQRVEILMRADRARDALSLRRARRRAR